MKNLNRRKVSVYDHEYAQPDPDELSTYPDSKAPVQRAINDEEIPWYERRRVVELKHLAIV